MGKRSVVGVMLVVSALVIGSVGVASAAQPPGRVDAGPPTAAAASAGSGQLSGFPLCITAGPDGNMWVREQGGTIAKVARDRTVTEYTPLADTAPAGYITPVGPHCMTAGVDGNLWYEVKHGTAEMAKVSTAGALLGEYPIPVTYDIGGVTQAPDGLIWFLANSFQYGMQLGTVTTTGTVTYPAAQAGHPANSGNDIVSAAGFPWLENGSTITRMNEDFGSGYSFTAPGFGDNPAIAPGPDGRLWTAGPGAITMTATSESTTRVTLPDPPPGVDLPRPYVIAPSADHNMYWVDSYDGRQDQLGVFDAAGNWEYYNLPGVIGALSIAAGPDGEIWFADSTNNTVHFVGVGYWNRFLEHAYVDMLGRPADAAAESYYGMRWFGTPDFNQDALAGILANSDEYLLARVDRLYVSLLRRHAEPGGQTYWAGRLRGGWRAETLESALIGSDEYFNVEGHGNIDTYIASVYQDLLGRAPEPSGAAYWHNQLASGAPRQSVADGIVFSREALTKVVTDLYAHYLHRGTDPGGLNYWTDQLQAGMTDEHLVVLLVSSDEYFNNAQQG